MKGGQSENKAKVVIRHLPPGISQAMLMEQIDGAFSGWYRWVSFRPGKTSHLDEANVQVSGSMSQQQNVASSDKSLLSSTSVKQSPRREGRLIRSILLNKDSRQNQSSGNQSEQNIWTSFGEKDKRPPRPPKGQYMPRDMNGASDDKVVGIDLHVSSAEKLEKRVRNKERPDRVVWTPLRRSDGSYANDESLSSQSAQSGLESSQGNPGDVKTDVSNSRSDVKNLESGRNSYSSIDNGSQKHFGMVEGKPSKRNGGSGFGSHEKQVWVQKSGSGS